MFSSTQIAGSSKLQYHKKEFGDWFGTVHGARYWWKFKIDPVIFLGVVRYVQVFSKCCKKTLPISLERDEWLSVFFLHKVKCQWKLWIYNDSFVGCGQACADMPKIFRNKELSIPLEKGEWLSWYFLYSLTLMEFKRCSQVCAGMCKVLQINKLPIFLEKDEYLSLFFCIQANVD